MGMREYTSNQIIVALAKDFISPINLKVMKMCLDHMDVMCVISEYCLQLLNFIFRNEFRI